MEENDWNGLELTDEELDTLLDSTQKLVDALRLCREGPGKEAVVLSLRQLREAETALRAVKEQLVLAADEALTVREACRAYYGPQGRPGPWHSLASRIKRRRQQQDPET